jgi:hypothetical protein
MWSGAWRLTATRRGRDVALTGGLASMSTMIGAGTASEGPHGFFGIVPGSAAHVTAAMQAFIVNGVRSGRPLTPLVTYNTWFAYGTAVDEPAMHDEMTRVAALGTELFVLGTRSRPLSEWTKAAHRLRAPAGHEIRRVGRA